MRGRGGGGGAAGPSTKGGRGGRAGPGARARAGLGSPEEHGWAGPGFGVGWASRSSLRACGRSSPQFPSLHCCTAREGRGKSRSAVRSPTPTLPFADLDHMGTFSAGDGPFRRPTRASWTQHVPSGRGERGQDRHARGRRAGRRERGESKQGSRAAGRRRRSVSALGPRGPSLPRSYPPVLMQLWLRRATRLPLGWSAGRGRARTPLAGAGRRQPALRRAPPAAGGPCSWHARPPRAIRLGRRPVFFTARAALQGRALLLCGGRPNAGASPRLLGALAPTPAPLVPACLSLTLPPLRSPAHPRYLPGLPAQAPGHRRRPQEVPQEAQVSLEAGGHSKERERNTKQTVADRSSPAAWPPSPPPRPAHSPGLPPSPLPPPLDMSSVASPP